MVYEVQSCQFMFEEAKGHYVADELSAEVVHWILNIVEIFRYVGAHFELIILNH